MRISRGVSLYLGKSILQSALVVFLILEAVQGIIFTVNSTGEVSFDILLMFPILIMAFTQALGHAIPVALLLGTGLVVGRLNADREVLALRSFGVSPLQMVAPVLLLGTVATGLSWHINQEWVPRMRYGMRNAETMILESLNYIGEGWDLELSQSGFSLWVEHYDGPRFDGVLISLAKSDRDIQMFGNALESTRSLSYPVLVYAERGEARRGVGENEGRLEIELSNVKVFLDHGFSKTLGRRYRGDSVGGDGDRGGEGSTGASGDRGAAVASEAELGDEEVFKQCLRLERWTLRRALPRKTPTPKDVGGAELQAMIVERARNLEVATASGDPKAIQEAREYYDYTVSEPHRRAALALCCLTFPLAALAMGLFVTSQNRLLPFFLASTIAPALYFPLEMFGGSLARQGIFPAFTQQLGTLALVVLAAAFLIRITLSPRG